MLELQTKEHVVQYMCSNNLRLSLYDDRFLRNMQNLILQKLDITSNQVMLLDKLINKYKRQFIKHGVNVEKLDQLKWTSNIVQSLPLFTDAFITVADNKIYFRAPYKKDFLSAFRKQDLNTFVWVKELKRYEAPYSTHSLKLIVNLAFDFYAVVNYCPITVSLLDALSPYENVQYWTPTLVDINNNLLIAATNENLDKAIKDIPLNLDIKTISLLAEYGVSIAESLITQPKLKFASEFVTDGDITNIDEIIKWLIELQCDCVFFLLASGLDRIRRASLEALLTKVGIAYESYNDGKSNETYKHPIIMQFSSHYSKLSANNIRKIIRMTNSHPVNVK